MTTARVGIVLLLGVSVAQGIVQGADLPDVVASNFDGSGRAHGWMSRAGFLALHFGMVGLLGALFLVLPVLLVRLPPQLVNLPNRDYWLAPERRVQTMERLASDLDRFGLATVAFLVWVMDTVIRANLSAEPRLGDAFVWVLGAYLVFAGWWTVRIFRRHRVPA
jgi:hypothetical protein